MNGYPTLEFPRAFAFAIDDLGWNEGSSLAYNTPPGPYRAGVKRTFDIHDYRAIIDVGKAVGARIQSLFVLSEMDRKNILAKYPTTTYMRERWDNSSLVKDSQVTIMHYVRDQAAFMEFGFHGTGHEYWAGDGIQRRAEWYNLTDRQPWPEESLRGHVKAFGEILSQYDLAKAHGHSFPETFVPCAYSCHWNPEGNYSVGTLMSAVGVKYANTDFGQIPELNPPADRNGGGFDHGLHVINRNNYGNPWYAVACLPNVTLDLQYTDVIESHWPNWLAHDDFLQEEVTRQWVEYYRAVQRFKGRYIAKNTEQLHSQWLYNKYTRISYLGKTLEIDNTQMPDEAYATSKPGNMVLKVKLNQDEHVSSASIDGQLIPAYFEDQGFAFLYLPPLGKKKYTLTFEIGKEKMPLVVYNDGTYNVYGLTQNGGEIKINTRVYGSQIIKVQGVSSGSVRSDNKSLIIEKTYFKQEAQVAYIHVKATDFQGVTGNILLSDVSATR